MPIIHASPSGTLNSLPGVIGSWFSSDLNASSDQSPVTGWLACPKAGQPNLISSLKRDFGPGVHDRGFFFGRWNDANLTLLVFDPERYGVLPPGFVSIGFLNDRTEGALVKTCSSRIAECELGAAQAALLMEKGSSNEARDLVSLTVERLRHVLSSMFWRDFSVSHQILPSGPWRTLQVSLDRVPDGLLDQIEHLSAVIQGARRLLSAHHCNGSAPDLVDLPSWYDEFQANSYDQHRYFPDCIGPQVAAVLGAMAHRNVTEIGVGTGRFSLAVLNAGAHQDFTLLDNSRSMLDRLRGKLPSSVLERVTVDLGTIDGLANAPNMVDILLEHEVFFLHPNPDRLARNLARALRPDGFIARLERSTQSKARGTNSAVAFDRQVAAGLGSPIGFVGEDCASAVDKALGLLGFETVRLPLTEYSREVTSGAMRVARESRTFPYLSHVPKPVLDAALGCLSGPDEGCISFEERYDLAISYRSKVVKKNQLHRILNALPHKKTCLN